MEDRQLLRRFVEQNSQEAFAALTARYLNLVYSVCRRELADAEAAEDVTQAVFLILARKAPTLRQGVILSGWLFQTARFAAKNARLQAQRRAAYEQKAAEEMGEQSETSDAAWAEIEPVLNRALAALGAGERECVLLRFFQGLSFAEAGAALNVSEEAARKRVTRALEKMRRFFTKEGIAVPGVALAALLSSHAAKAAPITCQAVLTHIENTVLAGQVPMGLTGSHGYQLAEGVTKAMKITQTKVAVGLSAAVLIGLTTYTVAREIASASTTSYAAPVKLANLKPGHVLVQPAGGTLTARQIIEHCQQAYSALQTFQCTTEVTEQSVTSDGRAGEQHSTAAIKFVRPGEIKVDATDTSGNSFAYVSDGAATMQKNPLTHGGWTKAENTEQAIGTIAGIDGLTGTTIPSLLLGIGSTHLGNPFTSGYDPEVREDDVDGHPCYVVTNSLIVAINAQRAAFWIDEKTFLLRRYVLDSDNAATYFMMDGKQQNVPATQVHNDQRITNERLNDPIPDSAFTLPPSQ